jgi:CO/xanthine dehydrogenase Mo-binding subunit
MASDAIDAAAKLEGEKTGSIAEGIGVAIGMHHTSFWPSSGIVKMNQDGTANVLSGAVEMGQGYGTALAQVVAEELGIPPMINLAITLPS